MQKKVIHKRFLTTSVTVLTMVNWKVLKRLHNDLVSAGVMFVLVYETLTFVATRSFGSTYKLQNDVELKDG